jgi:hypothetical protein
MKKYGITFLAFGEEHIKEFNNSVKCLFDLDNHLDIFVITDNEFLIENKNVHIKEVKEPFNYNLKRKCFEFAFQYHNIVVFMDTDILISGNVNLDEFGEINEGMYVRYVSDTANYIGNEITISNIMKTDYGKLIGDSDIKFINEFLMVLRIDDTKKRNLFVKGWDELNELTLNHQPNNGEQGSLEGLIVYAVCNRLGIKVNKIRNWLFNNIHNIGTLQEFRRTKINKSLL